MDIDLDIDPATFFNFVTQPELNVLFLSTHPSHRLNESLLTELENKKITFGRLLFSQLLAAGPEALAFLRTELLASNATTRFPIPPGYYLFCDGQLVTWQLGLPAFADAKTILSESWLGAACSWLTKDIKFLRLALTHTAQRIAAARMASEFLDAAAKHQERPHSATHTRTSSDDELSAAYARLNVSPSATDAEVTNAWRQLQRRYHPDRAARDPDEFERLSRLCVEINQARDVIFAHRKQTKRGDASAA